MYQKSNSNFSFTKSFVIVALFLFSFSCSTNEVIEPKSSNAVTQKRNSFNPTSALNNLKFNLNDPAEAYLDAVFKMPKNLNNKLSGLSRKSTATYLKRIEELANNPTESNSKELILMMGYKNEQEYTQSSIIQAQRKKDFLLRHPEFNKLNNSQKRIFLNNLLSQKLIQSNPSLRIATDPTAEECEHDANVGFALDLVAYLAEAVLCEAFIELTPLMIACQVLAADHFVQATEDIKKTRAECLAKAEEAEKKQKE